MDKQHRISKGYRDLSAEEITLMNQIKEAGTMLEILLSKVESHIEAQELACNAAGAHKEDGDIEEAYRISKAAPRTWHALAKTDLQVGIMKLVRAVAQPTSF